MLNELLTLERGMAEFGFATVPRHPDVSQLLKGDVVRVRLDARGTIADLELLERETRPDIWTLRDGKQNGFPGLKTGRGLLKLSGPDATEHDAIWKAAKSAAAKRLEIARLASIAVPDPEAEDWPKPRHRIRIAERLVDLRSLDGRPETRAVPAAFERFLAAMSAQPAFLHQVCAALLERVRNGENGWLEIARAAMVGAIPLAIDVSREFERDAGDGRQIEAVSRALAGSGSGAGRSSRGRICALTGAETQLLEGNFPQPTLPSLGQTYLFSRNSDIRALARYGRNGPSSMPIEADLVSRFSGAIAEVTSGARHLKTWRLLPASAGDGQDLFIAFIASAMDAEVARSLSEDEDEDEQRSGAAEVEQAASRLIQFWKGIADKAPPGERARILILRTVDPGNRKAVYDSSPSVEALHSAARAWAAAMANAPDWITFSIFKAKKPVAGRPRPQAPLSLVALSKKLYVRGGREAVKAPGVSGAEALALFLDEGDRARRARRLLRLLLDRHTGLLVGATQAKLRDQLKDFDPKATARVDGLRSVAWLGALLSFLGRTKESYMEGTGFKLGQLLSAVDAVHLGYCAEVRGGDIPPTLVGNSVFAAAGRNPDRALDVLQTRWKPYHAWVTKLSEARKGSPSSTDPKGRAVSQAEHATRLCEDLQPLLASMRRAGNPPDEAFRAELLLGYLAGVNSEKMAGPAEQGVKGSGT